VNSAPHSLIEGLIAYWKLDNNFNDEVGNYDWNNNGGSINSPGIVNTCVEFNNGTTGQYATAPSISLNYSASLSFWLNFSASQPLHAGVLFKAYGSPHGDQSIFGAQAYQDSVLFSVQTSSSNGVSTKYGVNYNQWYYFIWVFDATAKEAKLYVNGAKVKTLIAAESAIFNPTSKMKMGMQKYSDRSFHGKIDEIGVWNRALTEAEVQQLYNSGNGNQYPFMGTTNVPSTPQNLTATPDNQQITLTWSPNTESDLEKYNVYSTTDTTAGFSLLASVNKPDTIYTHTGLTNGTTYYYKITAVDSAGNESGFSDVVSATPSASDLLNGLIAYYTLGGDAIDASGNNYHGTINGATETSGKLGNAMSFSGGSDNIKLPQFSVGNTFTFSAWYKINNIPQAQHKVISEDYIVDVFANSDGNMYANVGNGSTWGQSVGYRFALNEWEFVTVTYNGSMLKIYKNGQLKGSVNNSKYVTNWLIDIGNRYGAESSTYGMNGAIDEVAIYNRVLSQTEITELYNNGAGKRPDILKLGNELYYSFDNGTATDLSGNENDGVLHNWVNFSQGKINKSIMLDGNDDYLSVDLSSYAGNYLTAILWFNSSGWIGGYNSLIFHKTNIDSRIYIHETDGLLRYFAGAATSEINTNAPSINNWHQAAIILNDGEMKGYLDNNLIGQTNYSTFNDYGTFEFGRFGYNDDYHYEGRLDEIAIFTRPLSKDEISLLYNSGKGYNPYTGESGS
jgi:hypothetical protein